MIDYLFLATITPTPDGTGVRDYIHVMDLAEGHIAALNVLREKSRITHIYNLGTGKGSSVLEMVDAFAKACGNQSALRYLPSSCR